MSPILKDTGLWIAGFDFAGVTNEVNLSVAAEAPNADVIANLWKTFEEGGTKEASFGLQGFYGRTDAEQFLSLGNEHSAMLTPAGRTPGEVAYIVPIINSGYEPSGSIGEIIAMSYAAIGTGETYRAQVFDIRDNVTANVTTARLDLGAIPSGQTLHLWVHADRISAAGSMAVELSSATAQTGGATTSRGTAAITGTDLHRISVDGPVTDEYWFLEYTPSTSDYDVASASHFAAQLGIATPVTPITPPPSGTVNLKGGLSVDAIPVAAELTIDGANHVLSFPSFASMHVLIARLEVEADITSVVLSIDPTMANQIGGWTKFAGLVTEGGDDYKVWVSNQVLTFPAPTDIEAQ